MLTPQYLARAPDRVVNLYQKLEDFIIADLVRRLTTSVGKVATPDRSPPITAGAKLGT